VNDRHFLELIAKAQAADRLRESLRKAEATGEIQRARAQWTKAMLEEWPASGVSSVINPVHRRATRRRQ